MPRANPKQNIIKTQLFSFAVTHRLEKSPITTLSTKRLSSSRRRCTAVRKAVAYKPEELSKKRASFRKKEKKTPAVCTRKFSSAFVVWDFFFKYYSLRRSWKYLRQVCRTKSSGIGIAEVFFLSRTKTSVKDLSVLHPRVILLCGHPQDSFIFEPSDKKLLEFQLL